MAVGIARQPPDPQAEYRHQNRNRQEPEEVRQSKPALGDKLPAERGPDTYHRNDGNQRQQNVAGQLAHPVLQRAFAFHDQPRGGQQGIGDN